MSDVQVPTRLARVIVIVDPGFSRDPMEIVVNRGSSHGLKAGDKFLVYGIGPHIHDPETGEDLGDLELVRGQGEVVHVQEKMATLRSTARRRTKPARRVIRQGIPTIGALSHYLGAGSAPGSFIEEEIAAEAELPFDSVAIGDYAKPI